ncbi:glycosyltransferase [Chitinivibrio alkaliphilus]|uniref:GT1_YagM_like family glycosyltransferase n=1 Tax=Chitinivibrio alkaliphilus ACht1 TaxID=1313304 RepID=U7D572_9BACT|nr:glycosyltransferase [Chitinivibrio alkaliphilus]ERP31093.1 GT1_YagM_like family glycosyltransferase [Chitinivibrio alkaliphilus ACht1]
MKILYTIPYPHFFSQHDGVGGHIAHCMGILAAMKEQGHEVLFMSEESYPHLEEYTHAVITHPKTTTGPASRLLWLAGFFSALKKEIDRHAPDVVYMRYSASAALLFPLLKKALGTTKLILEVNSLGSQHKPILRVFDKPMLGMAHRVVCISRLLGEYVENTLAIPCRVVPNGISPERIPEELIEKASLTPHSPLRIVYAGLLKPQYGLETAVEALDGLVDKHPLEFIFYGDGPLMPQLRDMAEKRPWLHLAGPIDFADMPRHLVKADVLFYPTSTFNSFQSPTKLFEYMAAARPIVAAQTKQTTELLEEGALGQLFEIDSPDEIRTGLEWVVSHWDLACEQASLARKKVLENHTWTARLTEILSGEDAS